ncbi:hypothetical protein L6164_022278 [Bauhinia variegata]|uniref:Uncharacterized protein n=1 Tax=Bauhinia variegata TaxID=167791 RepID=A0ACB9MG25_BAUVA|nr:hypothetical protein L6164_022278 [Bauhinia variegata]
MRNVSKNKILLCFRPVVDIDVMLDSKPAVDLPRSRRFAGFHLEEKDSTKVSETKSMVLDKGSLKFSENSIANSSPKRTLSRVIKAVVFEKIMNRRASQKDGYFRDSFGSKRSYSTNTETSSTGDEKSILSQASMDTNMQETKTCLPSSSSSSFGSGSSCLSQETESGNISKWKESSYQALIKKQKNWDCTGIHLLVISLIITVLWGKIFGIILTSIWLCLQPRSAAGHRLPQEVAKLAKTGPKVDYRKRGHNGRTARKELQ